MFLAIQQGYFSKAIEYIESGEDVNIRDAEGKTPLIRCIFLKDQQKSIGLARALLAHGAKISQRDRNGLNALHYSCIARLPLLVDILLSSLDCDVNVRCRKTGNTALHFSAIAGDEEVSRKLVKHIRRYELNIDVLNRDGDTALQLAIKFSNDAIVDLLVASGANSKLRLQPQPKLSITAASTASNASVSAARKPQQRLNERPASWSSNSPTILKKRKKLTPTTILDSANMSNSMKKSMSYNRARTTTTIRIIEPMSRSDSQEQVSWREMFPIIWAKYTQQNSASFRKAANFEEGEELHKQLSEQEGSEVNEEIMVAPTVPRRRNSSMAYLGPPVSRRGSLVQGPKGQLSKVETMRSRRQSMGV